MPIKATPPGEEQGSPYDPPGPKPSVFEQFDGIDQATTRAGVPDAKMAWCDGWFPLSPRYLRTMWDVGPLLWTAPTGTIAFYDFANIGTLPVMIAVTSTGGIWQVVTNTVGTNVKRTATQIAANGTIQTPLRAQVGVSQWGEQYVLIVANQTNGYWIWDGSILYTAGTLAPGVTLTNVGSGYSTPPVVLATGGEGHGATFSAAINTIGQVTSVAITNPGSGYLAGNAVTLSFTGGNTAGSGVSLTANLSSVAGGSGATVTINYVTSGSNRSISSIVVTNGGSGYTSFATVTVNPGTWTVFTAAIVSLTVVGGVVTAVNIANPYGSISPAENVYGVNGSTALSVVISDQNYFYVSSVTINSGGTLYSPSATITASGGGNPQSQATLTPVISGGVIVNVIIVSGGVYGSNSAPTLAANDTATTAAGTISLMPYAIQGTTIETYSGHVWIANGAVISFSAPGSVSDFSTANGGGNTTSVDSFLRVGYTQLKNSNGFLYLIADSSINYISGVTTTGSPTLTTTFTNQNADPEVGTPYPATVDVFSRNIVFANAFGAHVSYGAAVTKISEPLDAIYNTVTNFSGFQLSACKAIIFGRKVWAMLVPVIDPISNNQVNKLFVWDSKKWVATHQSVNLVYVQHQEIASIITAWGTDGLNVYPLFTTPSSSFQKIVQSKFWDSPGYQNTKASVRLWALAQFLGSSSLSYTVTVDNENGLGTANASVTGNAATFSWVNGSGVAFSWQNGSAATFTWAATGTGITAVLPPQSVGQVGVLTGLTTTTNCDDMILISEMLENEVVSYRG